MKKIISIVLLAIVLSFIVYLWTPRGCAQVVTPAGNIFTGDCKTFSDACLPFNYKQSDKCSLIYQIEMLKKVMAEYPDKDLETIGPTMINQMQQKCETLSEKDKKEVLNNFNVDSCQNIFKTN